MTGFEDFADMMDMKNKSLFALLLILVSSAAMAIPQPQKGTKFLEGRLYKGGQAGFTQSLLGIERKNLKAANAERIRFVFGSDKGTKSNQPLGYFHVQHDVKNKRIVVDIAQLALTKVSEEQIRQSMLTSKAVSDVSFTTDPEDGSSTLVLSLKKPVSVRVAKQKTKFGPALALDLRLKK